MSHLQKITGEYYYSSTLILVSLQCSPLMQRHVAVPQPAGDANGILAQSSSECVIGEQGIKGEDRAKNEQKQLPPNEKRNLFAEKVIFLWQSHKNTRRCSTKDGKKKAETTHLEV